MRTSFRPFRRVQQVLAVALGGLVLGSVMPYPSVEVVAERHRGTSHPASLVAASSGRPVPPTAPPRPTVMPKASALPAAEPVAPPSPCPPDMVLVEGDYCTEPKHVCKHWLDDESLPFARCGEYVSGTRCAGRRVAKRFCIDRFESADPGELPINHQSYFLASKRCKNQDKRLCTESEWNFACEGEAMLPYPYGLKREPVCNQDRSDLFESNPQRRVLRDLRQPNDGASRCVSPFGVYNMVGNLDEPTRRETGQQPRFNNALKGGWWMAGRNRCRPATTAHDDYYRDIQIGVRCCADAPSDPPKPG